MERLLTEENAGQEEMAQAEAALINAILGLRKPVRKELIGSPVVLPQEVDTEQRDIGTLYRLMAYAENLDIRKLLPAVRASYQEAFEHAQQTFRDPQSNQNEINRAWAELLDKIQYAGYTMGDKTGLRKVLTDDRKIDLSLYQNPQAFAKVLAEAEQVLLDENTLDGEIRQIMESLGKERAKLVQGSGAEKHVPGQVENVKAKSQTKGLQITWKQQADTFSYTVYIQKDGK